jgi:hypothetical protein
MIKKAHSVEGRIRSLRGKFGLTPENVRQIHVPGVQDVALSGSELWWVCDTP